VTKKWIKSILLLFYFLFFFNYRTKFFEFDMKPVCKKCYEKFPTELKKRISDNLKEREADTLRRRSASPSTTGHNKNNKDKMSSKSPEIK
jgi:hypothetical protein